MLSYCDWEAKTSLESGHCGATGSGVDKDSKGQRKREMTLWGNRERCGQGQQGTEKERDDIVGQQGAVWTRIARDRERWRTLAEDYFLQWKHTA